MEKQMWLLQTGSWKHNIDETKEVEGFSHFVFLHYMGAAEYEMKNCYLDGKNGLYNPLYLSLKRMYEQKDSFDYFKMVKRKDALGRQMYIYCRKEDEEWAKEAVREQIKKEWVKRPALLGAYLKKTQEELENANPRFIREFWWDIENDVLIFFGDDKIEKINFVINTLYEKNKPQKVTLKDKIKSFFNKKAATVG